MGWIFSTEVSYKVVLGTNILSTLGVDIINLILIAKMAAILGSSILCRAFEKVCPKLSEAFGMAW